jgi:TonB family protein
MICASCGRRCDPDRSFCTNCGSSVFLDEPAKPAFSASRTRPSLSSAARRLQSLQRSATSFDPAAVARRARALQAAPSFRIGPLVRFAVLVGLLWYAANWLLDIQEVRLLKDAFQRGAFSDAEVSAAREAVRARLDAVLGRAPAPVAPPPVAPPRSVLAERPSTQPVAPKERPPDAPLLAPPATVRVPPGVFLPGDGVTLPRVLHQVKPTYTPEALRAKIEGSVVLQAVVRTQGVAGDISVVRSLDRRFGLDRQAIEAVRQWQFAPGQRMGQPVPVLVQSQIVFSAR